MKKRVKVTIITAISILVIIGLYFYISSSNVGEEDIFCTEDVKQCPDGSYVSRDSNNNCEFFVCPEAETEVQAITEQPLNYNINIRNYAFYPALLKIKVGDTVTWTNKDDDSHNIRSDPVGGEINSTKLKWNEQYLHTFTQPGNYTYYCSIHAGMRGRIVVE